MKIRIRLLGFLEGQSVHWEGTVEVGQPSTVNKLLKQADRSSDFKSRPVFQTVFKQKRPPSVMVNGDPLPLPEGLETVLSEGDEITILTPLAGG